MSKVASIRTETNHARGVRAEEEAVSFLSKKRFRILQKRYKTKFGEIDLIAEKRGLLCFIEVKARPTEAAALESITKRTCDRIEKSALFFLSEHPELMTHDMRFDVIAVRYDTEGAAQITHLDNAWQAGA